MCAPIGEPGAKGPRSPQSQVKALQEIAENLSFSINWISTSDGEYTEIYDPNGEIVYSDWSEPDLFDLDEWLDLILAWQHKKGQA